MTFERRIIRSSFLPDVVSAMVIFCYAMLSVLVVDGIDFMVFVKAAVATITMLVVAQFMIAPVIDHFLYRGVSRRLEQFKKGALNEQERTELLERLMQYPFICAVYTSVYFILGSIGLFTVVYVNLDMPLALSVLILCECLFGSYFSALCGYFYSNKICSSCAIEIVQAGVDKKYVMAKKYFGTRIKSQIMIYVAIPIISATIITAMVLTVGFLLESSNGDYVWSDRSTQFRRMGLTCVMNLVIEVSLVLLFFKRIHLNNKRMNTVLKSMQGKSITTVSLLDTDVEDEISYNHFLVNQMLLFLRSILSGSAEIGQEINKFSLNLMTVSNETESTAIEQSTGISEIVSTMENASKASRSIEEHIAQVSSIATETASDVFSGSQVLQENLAKMRQIEQSNEDTISGIRDLSEKINSIWEIVNIINSIADQTKIIAFNAELEATGVNNGNKNFRNVANEIRRLANSTMDSTHEIKQRINEMQAAADSLIKSSQSSTSQIRNGMQIAHSLEERFININISADQNAASAEEIKRLVNQQTVAFEQIVKTLQQISTGIQNFSVTTRTIIDTSDMLGQSAKELESIAENSVQGE